MPPGRYGLPLRRTGPSPNDRVKYGPLFDYSPDGKFKSGSLNVDAYTYGALVMIYHPDTKTCHYSPFATDIFTSQVVRATMYR